MNLLLCVTLLGSLLGALDGYKMYQDRIPNGDRVPHPCLPNYLWHGVGHKNVQGGGERNPFGLDFAANSFMWDQTLCEKDSDGDGRTNGQELGDPECVWTVGTVPSQTMGLSHPGVCEPLSSGACNATNNWDFCSQKEFECAILNTPDVKNVTLSLEPTAIPATETNYYCQVFDLPSDSDYHIIANKPALDNENVIHHILLFGCGEDSTGVLDTLKSPKPCGMQTLTHCGSIIGAWTVGGVGLCNTGEAGTRIGASSYTRALLQVHWNNPELKSDYVDGSGITIYYTANLRPYDLATMSVSQAGLRIPPGQASWTHTATCPSSCTKSRISQTIKVIGVNLHMHYMGRAGSLTQYRDGAIVNILANDNQYSYDRPEGERHSPPKEILPGDELKLSCTFKSTSHSSAVYFGDSTQAEMCIGFVSYYPAQKFNRCLLFGNLTFCDNQTNPEDTAGCVMDPSRGGMGAAQTAIYRQLVSKCDITGSTCKPECLSLFTENPHPCLTGDVKLMGESFFPRVLGERGNLLQSASRSCDTQLYDGSLSAGAGVVSFVGKLTLSLVAIMVTLQVL